MSGPPKINTQRGINNSRFSDTLFREIQALQVQYSLFDSHYTSHEANENSMHSFGARGKIRKYIRRWRALNEVESTTEDSFFYRRSTCKGRSDLDSMKETQPVGFRKSWLILSFVIRSTRSTLSRNSGRNGFCCNWPCYFQSCFLKGAKRL